jgi:signal transduction histidine kinase
MNTSALPTKSQLLNVWRELSAATVRGYRAYGAWLVGLSWARFAVLAVLLLIAAGVLQNVPPFNWSYTETVVIDAPKPSVHKPKQPSPPAPPAAPQSPRIVIEKDPAGSAPGSAGKGVNITIGEDGIRIRKLGEQERAAPAAAPPASATAASATAASGASAPDPGRHEVDITADGQGVRIVLPPGADSEAVRAAVEEARQAVIEAMQDARDAQAEAKADAEAAAADAAAALGADDGTRVTTRTVHYGESLPQLAFLWILLSALMKATYKGRLQAEVKAARAAETADAESLKRQVIEARMAAMQAQVEPHFLFNTLASIDHLIETDPPRASQMQKNLIALLRASMPTMRDTGDNAGRDLGRELAVVKPYVEILKVRMEERLDARIEVPDGLLSAEFPAMMIQTLVENAIRHGLEPKPEGGQLRVRAEIVHGKLAVTVADTGVGFGHAATAGTGVGLANIRERLQLLHGGQASLTVTANQPSGTVVTITVPYRTVAASAGGAPQSPAA